MMSSSGKLLAKMAEAPFLLYRKDRLRYSMELKIARTKAGIKLR